MADIVVDGDELVPRLSRAEKLEAVHGDLRAPRAAVRSVEVLEDAHEPADHGLKVGERLPGYPEVAVVRTHGQIDYDAWIVGLADPESLKHRIEQP